MKCVGTLGNQIKFLDVDTVKKMFCNLNEILLEEDVNLRKKRRGNEKEILGWMIKEIKRFNQKTKKCVQEVYSK